MLFLNNKPQIGLKTQESKDICVANEASTSHV
jgi:hypothetical protein